MTKTAILVFFLSLSKDEILFRRLNYLTLIVVNVAGGALTFLNIFQCRPPYAAFTYPVPENASCTDIVTLYLSSAPVNIITDLAILLLPMPILTGMRLPKKQKIILVATFSAGVFVAVVDVVRLAYLQSAAFARLSAQTGASGKSNGPERGADFSWNASLSFMWSAVEVNLGLICACVPSLKPLFLRFAPRFIKDVNDTSHKGSHHEGENGHALRSGMPGNELTNPAAFRTASPKEKAGTYGGEGGFLDFLTSPDDDDMPSTPRDAPLSKSGTRGSNYDFYEVSQTQNMLKLSNRQSVRPVMIVTVLFFLWGFAYGLLDVLNNQFQRVVGTTPGEGLGLHAAYYGGYFVGPLTIGRLILKRYGFKASMIAGLAIYGCGTLVFWPSSVLGSYVAFIISNFIVGLGLSCLEVSANPYIAFCGPLEYAEVRLNLSQGFQAIGSILSPLFASRVLFKSVHTGPSLIQVQWTYLGIALFGWALALAFYYVKLPEASDEELDEQADRNMVANQVKIGPLRIVWVTLALGVSSQFFYVGAQEAVGNNLGALFARTNERRSSDYVTVGHTVFAVGRFLSAFLNYVLKPRWIVLVLYLASIASCIMAMNLNGAASIAAGQLIYFFESGIFSVLFCVALRGLGTHTKTGSAFMTAAISGGAVFPVIQAAAERSGGLKYSFCVAAAAFAGGTIFAIYLNVLPAARKQIDPVHEDRTARRNRRHAQHQASSPTKEQFGLAGIIARRRKMKKAEAPMSEHLENESSSKSSNEAASPAIDQSHIGPDDVVMLRSPSPIRMRRPSGYIGELKPWPGN